jgi:glycosyltransferase involved in cell wall biosynthesis
MKVGLYVVDFPATLGGGYVMRDDVARAAPEFKGRHEIELVRASSLSASVEQSTLRQKVARLLRRGTRSRDLRRQRVESEIRRRGIQLLWFNHVEPLDVDIPYILNIFDLQHRLQPWFPEVSANGLWDLRESLWSGAIKRASIVTVGSQEAKEQLSHFYGVPLSNIHVVPFPTPRAALDAAATSSASAVDAGAIKEKYGIKGEFLFYPAQFWAHKNHVNLLHALRLLHDQHGLRLPLVLTGSDQGSLSHVREITDGLGLTPYVHYLGFVPHEDVIAFYRSAFALSYVSFFGPENLPPLEAMALGCSVVLSDIPGVQTLFGDGPVLVDPRRAESIAAGIKWLHDNPDLRCQRAQAGKEIAIRNTPEQYVRNIQAILDDFEPMRRCWP